MAGAACGIVVLGNLPADTTKVVHPRLLAPDSVRAVMQSLGGRELDSGIAVCPPCEITAWRVGRLTGGRNGIEDHQGTAAIGADGRLYFATMLFNRPLYAGDLSTDRVVPLMGVGSGPGEVRYVSRVQRGTGDSLLVHDRSLNRMSLLSPDGGFVRSIPFLPGADDFVPLGNGSFFVAARISTRESSGYPLHLVGADGQLVKSFGVRDGEIRLINRQDELRLYRWIAPASDGSIIAVRPGGYVLERWAPDGRLLMERDVAPEWFTPKYERWRERPLDDPPPPYVADLQEGPDGRIWVLVRRAGEQWREGIRPPRKPPVKYEVISEVTFRDTQIEVFDPETFTRVASYRMDEILGTFVAPGVAVAENTVVNDEPIIELWRMRVLR